MSETNILRVCAYCRHEILVDNNPGAEMSRTFEKSYSDNYGIVSHGICEPCFQVQRAELELRAPVPTSTP
jgi:hypothetical protein